MSRWYADANQSKAPPSKAASYRVKDLTLENKMNASTTKQNEGKGSYFQKGRGKKIARELDLTLDAFESSGGGEIPGCRFFQKKKGRDSRVPLRRLLDRD